MTDGVLEVLNVGLGHLRVTFERDDIVERERARRMVSDMLARGYALFAEVEGQLVPIRAFDETRGEYLVTDVPAPRAEAPVPEAEVASPPDVDARSQTVKPHRGRPLVPPAEPALCRCGKPKGHRGRCPKATTKRLPMEKTKVIAVGRTAGG
jgi:hypothetical protein